MPSLRALFRPSRPGDKSSRTRGRHSWPRLRRSTSATVPLTQQPAAPAVDEDSKDQSELQTELDGATDVACVHEDEEPVDQEVRMQHEAPALAPVPEDRKSPRQSNDGSDHAQSQHSSQRGSKRLKGIMARFHNSRSQDRSSVSEALQSSELQSPEEPEVMTDPVKRDSSPSKPVALVYDAPEQKRNVSAQTAESQESSHTNATILRHPSQHNPMPVPESQEEWSLSQLVSFSQESAHLLEPSDPFSDGKNVEVPRQVQSSSKHSEDQSQEQIELSTTDIQAESAQQLDSKSHHSSRPISVQLDSRKSSVSSRASRSSRMSRLDPSKAIVAFNMLATQLHLQMSIPEKESIAYKPDEKPMSGEDGSTARRRRRLIGRVRPVQSNLTLGEASHTPISKLRRTKTFASLSRRPNPLNALQGRSVETLARVGGQSFLLLPTDLAPAPLQLPACIAATVTYLRRFASPSAQLFLEPGDIKAASQLYDHFADQVLTAEKEESKITMTMRVIAMPHWGSNSDPGQESVLSTAWVFKALLAGLPNGILGSTQLYQTLNGIYLAALTNPARARLITLAVVALTSEMQCGLICAVFGLLTGLLQVAERRASEDQKAGSLDRSVAGEMSADGLARVFGPLLVGNEGEHQNRDHPTQHKVEREIEEQRVAGLLLENWRSVSRQLREWMGGYSHVRAKREW